jgi:3-hydroxyisobutyrate dehydrogenase-like beta-hydroxyacid dehydrogenase
MTSQAAKRGLKLPVSDAVKALMEKAVKDGHGDQDLTSLFLSLT